ncbi:hypothetical protein ACFQ7N_08760 [Streptomyces niveus]|uniref:hypothetical protein n=1 Tax=Streptomyces niveus TaxID=193462 RepID=UPI00367A2C85
MRAHQFGQPQPAVGGARSLAGVEQSGDLQFFERPVGRVPAEAEKRRGGIRGERRSWMVGEQPVQQGGFGGEAEIRGVPHLLDHRDALLVEFLRQFGEQAG